MYSGTSGVGTKAHLYTFRDIKYDNFGIPRMNQVVSTNLVQFYKYINYSCKQGRETGALSTRLPSTQASTPDEQSRSSQSSGSVMNGS